MGPGIRLILAVVLAVPVATTASSMVLTSAFLLEFLGHGRWQPLTAISPDPAIRALDAPPAPGGPVKVDLYARPVLRRPPGLVLVHGLSPAGKDDPRLRGAAWLLARAGWAVAVPTVSGLTVLRLQPEDASAVSASVRGLRAAGYERVAVLGISLGAGPALLAAADPSVATGVSAVLALGGYASAVELLRYTLTGAYAYDGIAGRRPVLEEAIAQFTRANADLVDEAGRRLADNRDPAAFDDLVRALPAPTRGLLEALSPARVISDLRAPLVLVHGREDPAVPFTESLRLAAAARATGRPVRMAIVGAVAHVEAGRLAELGDLARLWAAFYAFRRDAER
ncbi:MAG TPA: prolyl oligopeptidase family serine peptidase [Methylomirabilota bacterium]|nr:prolyl oligopeptidase family serine peptidase [Methylomirabilota bacterium]